MSEFLIEIFSEEIPARMQVQAAEDLKKIVSDELQGRTLTFTSINTYVTPRRLMLLVEGLIESTVATTEERRGPKVGAPENALQGFLKSAGIKLEECIQREGYYYAHIEKKAQETRAVLPEIVKTFFSKMSWQKSMFWALKNGEKSQAWVRPVRSVLTLFNGKEVSFELPTLGITTGNKTYGHRFLAPQAIEVSSFADYQTKLEISFVVLDHQDRQTRIREGLESLARKEGLTLQFDEGLLKEVAGLVEYPVPLLGKIDADFMSLPGPVLSTSMRVHQKYFTLRDKKGNFAPFFGVVANIQASDGNAKMIAGYERVLRARLSDAAFFYKQDIEIPLEELSQKLHSIVFHAKLGSLGQKVERLWTLVNFQNMGQDGKRAATLAKADLHTSMVGEFPELQGVMGEIYALAQGENPQVAAAIREHYQPQGPNDDCPSAPLSVALALADKIDTLVGFFGIGEEPTGSKDPFALRRAALGIIRLIRENNFQDFSLESLCHEASEAYKTQNISFKNEFEITSVLDFINDRLKVALRGDGIRHDCVTAVIEGSKSTPYHYMPWAIAMRAKALQEFLETLDGQALLAAFRRAHGILKEEQKKDGIFYSGGRVARNQLVEGQELNLFDNIEKIISGRDALLKSHQYEELMSQLATLRPVVDAFFDLKVNHEDASIRAHRLELLGKLAAQTALIADFSHIEG
ncbi:MAG: glycine--tRNA ligase subunit beta [Alphaproteobacteria bacterium]|nr:glycine--tRNA ligase subunit beta [Alphaproteobacteria bacterium]